MRAKKRQKEVGHACVCTSAIVFFGTAVQMLCFDDLATFQNPDLTTLAVCCTSG